MHIERERHRINTKTNPRTTTRRRRRRPTPTVSPIRSITKTKPIAPTHRQLLCTDLPFDLVLRLTRAIHPNPPRLAFARRLLLRCQITQPHHRRPIAPRRRRTPPITRAPDTHPQHTHHTHHSPAHTKRRPGFTNNAQHTTTTTTTTTPGRSAIHPRISSTRPIRPTQNIARQQRTTTLQPACILHNLGPPGPPSPHFLPPFSQTTHTTPPQPHSHPSSIDRSPPHACETEHQSFQRHPRLSTTRLTHRVQLHRLVQQRSATNCPKRSRHVRHNLGRRTPQSRRLRSIPRPRARINRTRRNMQLPRKIQTTEKNRHRIMTRHIQQLAKMLKRPPRITLKKRTLDRPEILLTRKPNHRANVINRNPGRRLTTRPGRRAIHRRREFRKLRIDPSQFRTDMLDQQRRSLRLDLRAMTLRTTSNRPTCRRVRIQRLALDDLATARLHRLVKIPSTPNRRAKHQRRRRRRLLRIPLHQLTRTLGHKTPTPTTPTTLRQWFPTTTPTSPTTILIIRRRLQKFVGRVNHNQLVRSHQTHRTALIKNVRHLRRRTVETNHLHAVRTVNLPKLMLELARVLLTQKLVLAMQNHHWHRRRQTRRARRRSRRTRTAPTRHNSPNKGKNPLQSRRVPGAGPGAVVMALHGHVQWPNPHHQTPHPETQTQTQAYRRVPIQAVRIPSGFLTPDRL